MDNYQLQKRYFQVRLERFRQRPELHNALIEDCERYISMLEESGSTGDFMKRIKETGNMVSTAKAKALDRCTNRIAVFSTLGQQKKALEDDERLQVIRSARTHRELAEKLEAFENETRLSFNENKAMNALGPMMENLFNLCTDPPGSSARERSLAGFREYWKQMKEADPEVSWEKIMQYDAYRDRLIFTDGQLKVIEKVFREVQNG
ncbi:MAG: hypothetical protein GF388_11025 [Candidatus Aegiribacteria sp.]|nr:hypothetical protein [Candidatus Aegiribacteria sp.]MBD3295531.1 hypothetical protein [Candidatus Fermentibacteria bacterium]